MVTDALYRSCPDEWVSFSGNVERIRFCDDKSLVLQVKLDWRRIDAEREHTPRTGFVYYPAKEIAAILASKQYQNGRDGQGRTIVMLPLHVGSFCDPALDPGILYVPSQVRSRDAQESDLPPAARQGAWIDFAAATRSSQAKGDETSAGFIYEQQAVKFLIIPKINQQEMVDVTPGGIETIKAVLIIPALAADLITFPIQVLFFRDKIVCPVP